MDKTGLIKLVNDKVKKPGKLILVSRRFGKTYAAQMLKAYYTIGYDTEHLFRGLEISRMDPGLANRGKFDVIYIDMISLRSIARESRMRLTSRPQKAR